MVEQWDRSRHEGTGATVMITDASNKERDQINAMAQVRRIRAGELGSREVPLPGRPYGLPAGDEVIFSAQLPQPGDGSRTEPAARWSTPPATPTG
jgi:hypothetical protein